MTAIRFRPDSISIQGPAGDVVTKSAVKCIATTTLPLSSMQKYNYEGFKAFVMNASPASRDDSESDYSRV